MPGLPGPAGERIEVNRQATSPGVRGPPGSSIIKLVALSTLFRLARPSRNQRFVLLFLVPYTVRIILGDKGDTGSIGLPGNDGRPVITFLNSFLLDSYFLFSN